MKTIKDNLNHLENLKLKISDVLPLNWKVFSQLQVFPGVLVVVFPTKPNDMNTK